MSGEPGEVSLYVHVPFCRRKCSYCHFYVIPALPAHGAQYLDALPHELALRLPLLRGQRIVSLYLGGGTPTALGLPFLQRLFEILFRSVTLPAGCEITVEANPEDIDQQLVRGLLALGVNRMSMGLQSGDDGLLQLLGRRHSATQAYDAVRRCADAGMANLSVDLMYELPHQTLALWQRDIDAASALPLRHLSLYNLTFEPHTAFFKRRAELQRAVPPAEASTEMYLTACRRLNDRGFEQYEISAFAQQGYASLHNSGYWTGRPFVGLGPSAFSYMQGERWRNVCHFHHWRRAVTAGGSPVDFSEQLPRAAAHCERLAIGLRLLRGVDLTALAYAYGPLPPPAAQAIDRLLDAGLLQRHATTLSLTPQGVLLYDSVASEIVLDDDDG